VVRGFGGVSFAGDGQGSCQCRFRRRSLDREDPWGDRPYPNVRAFRLPPVESGQSRPLSMFVTNRRASGPLVTNIPANHPHESEDLACPGFRALRNYRIRVLPDAASTGNLQPTLTPRGNPKSRDGGLGCTPRIKPLTAQIVLSQTDDRLLDAVCFRYPPDHRHSELRPGVQDTSSERRPHVAFRVSGNGGLRTPRRPGQAQHPQVV